MRRRQGTGTIERARDGRHRVRITTDVGRRSLGVYATREEAEAVLAAAILRLSPTDGASLTLAMWGERELDRREGEGLRGIKTERNRWKMHLASSALGDVALSSIDRADVLAWLDTMSMKRAADRRGVRRLSRTTILNTLNLLRAIFESAVERHIVDENPAREVKVPKRTTRTSDPWTYLTAPEQAALLSCKKIAASDRRLLAFALGTGLRQGEQWSLEARDVHLTHAEKGPHVHVRFGSPGKAPKNGKLRDVPLFGIGLIAAREQLAHLKLMGPKKNPLGLMWPSTRGGRRSIGEPSGFKTWLRDAGITRRVRFHDLRHGCASALISGMWGRAWRREDVQAMLGHSAASSTERYAHLAPTALRAAAASMADASPRAQAKPAAPLVIGRKFLSHLGNLNPGPTVYEDDQGSCEVLVLDLSEAHKRASRALEDARSGHAASAIALAVDILEATAAEPAAARTVAS